MRFEKSIQEENEKRRLNILKSFQEVGTIQKAFKEEEEFEDDDDFELEDDTGDIIGGGEGKTTEDFASETSSDDLRKYISENPDGEFVDIAKEELSRRGEEDGVEFTTDYGNPQAVKEAIANHPKKDEIVQIMLDDPNLTASMALRLFESQNGNHEEISQKLDVAQQAIDDLKNSIAPDKSDDWFEDDDDFGMEDEENDDDDFEDGDWDDDDDEESDNWSSDENDDDDSDTNEEDDDEEEEYQLKKKK